MHWIEWFIGPQLIGVVFLLAGFIQKKYPPKKINNYYGYRMPSAMKNQETWDEANRFSTAYMIKAGMVLIVTGFLVTLLLYCIPMPQKFKAVTLFLVILAAGMGSAISMIMATEKHLSKTFDDRKYQ
ncbi:SdpI family protein [Mucilaginibacter mali]|uniref:SdpI family protein n=1 Tax=Mucilaginibacter mali TaxID=2740462 RepID=A0A7D4PYZ9_9SPHI|nr:SdpI family protein [Mucilaginibacter mali]QKJ28546.1 SdpI family protein [Mucilaginibacter mali]